MPDTARLLRMEEVAHKLGLSYTHIRNLILYEKKIPYFKVGARGIRVKQEDLEVYIASLEQKKEGKAGGNQDDRKHKDNREPFRGRGILQGDSGKN